MPNPAPFWRGRSKADFFRYGLGVALGIVISAILLAFVPATAPSKADRLLSSGPLQPDVGRTLSELVIQYVPESAPLVEVTCREFIQRLPSDMTVHVLCPDLSAFADLSRRLGEVRCRMHAIPCAHAMTCWSRDRWLALQPNPGDSEAGTVLLCSAGEDGAEIWPARAGDQRVAEDLAAARPGVSWRRSELRFDGGDFVADEQTVFVTPAVLRRNLGLAIRSQEDLRNRLTRLFKQKVILLEDAPDHHAGMFMMLAGHQTAVVGDPSLARKELVDAGVKVEDLSEAEAALRLPGGPDFSSRTQEQFDRVASRCAEAGYKVVRIPTLPARDGRTYLTYLNVILDWRPAQRTVYLPAYEHVPALNLAAARVWAQLGYRVQPVDCSRVFRHFGTLHCLVNVLATRPLRQPR